MNWIHEFCLALSCVTSLPVARLEPDEQPVALAKYLPAVGLVIGAFLLAAGVTLQALAVPHSVSAILLALFWLVLSGGIHLDGLMDSADGIFSHSSRERMLEIMRDSRVGNFGVMSGIVVLLLKICGLISLSGGMILCALLLVPAWARWCEVFAISSFPYAREEGMGKVWHDSTRHPSDLAIAAILPVVATIVCAINFGLQCALAATALPVVAGIAAAFYLAGIIRGHTGDTYGAVVEIAESGGLLLLLLSASRLGL